MGLDLTPIDLDELERYGLATFKCDRTLVSRHLERAIDEICYTAIGAVSSFTHDVTLETILGCQNEVNRRLAEFNRSEISRFNSGLLARAEAEALVKLEHQTEYHSAYISYEFWVNYTGITQEQADALPKYVRDAFYTNYLRGWSSQTKAQLAMSQAKDAVGASLKTFIGKPMSRYLTDQMKVEIKRALSEIEDLDLNAVTINVNEGQIQIQAFVDNQVIRINGTYA
jgi:hypothetical protein